MKTKETLGEIFLWLLCATWTHHRAVSVTKALNSKNTSREVTNCGTRLLPALAWGNRRTSASLAGEHDPLGKSFGEALEIAKRQKCKYANSIRTRATEELASLIGTNRFTGWTCLGITPNSWWSRNGDSYSMDAEQVVMLFDVPED